MRIRKTITLSWLISNNACGNSLKEFQDKFGNKAPLRKVLNSLRKHPEGEGWSNWLFHYCICHNRQCNTCVASHKTKGCLTVDSTNNYERRTLYAELRKVGA